MPHTKRTTSTHLPLQETLRCPSEGWATFSSNCLQATYAQTYAQRPKMKSISLGRRSPLTRNRFVLPLYAYILRCLIDLCCNTCTNCDVWSTFAAIRIHIAMPDRLLSLYAFVLRCLIDLCRYTRGNCDAWSIFAAMRREIAMPDRCSPLYARKLRCMIDFRRYTRGNCDTW